MSSTATRAVGGATDLQKHMMLLAASDDDPIRGMVRFQHMMFMASVRRRDSPIRDAGFVAGERGPHSEAVAGELARLVDAGMFAPGDDIALTAAGKEAAAGFAKDVPPGRFGGLLAALCNYKEFVNDLDDDEVQVFSYLQYPHMTLHGDEYGRLEPRTRDVVLGMAAAEKVTTGRAAELMGVNITDVWAELKRRGAHRPKS